MGLAECTNGEAIFLLRLFFIAPEASMQSDRLTTAAAAIRMAWEVCAGIVPAEVLKDLVHLRFKLQIMSSPAASLMSPGQFAVFRKAHVIILHGCLHSRSCCLSGRDHRQR